MGKNSVENGALKKLLSYQDDVARAEQVVSDLQATIDGKKQELTELESFSTNLSELREQQEDILADISMGMDKHAELSNLEAVILEEETKQQQHSEALAIASSTIKPTITGLCRKLSDAEAELSRMALAESRGAPSWCIARVIRAMGGQQVVRDDPIRLSDPGFRTRHRKRSL